MKGQFSLGLLDVFGYFIPGGLLLVACLAEFYPDHFKIIGGNNGLLLLAIVSSYLIGHVIAFMSGIVTKARNLLVRMLGKNNYLEGYDFYNKLKPLLETKYAIKIDEVCAYYFSRLLIADKSPNSALIVERLHSLTHFSRNVTFSLFTIASIYAFSNTLVSVVSLLLSIVFFTRYIIIGRYATVSGLRAAYVYYINQEHERP